MKTNLLRRNALGLIISLSLFATQSFAQTESLTGGSMGASDADSWKVSIVAESDDITLDDDEIEYEFGSSESCDSCQDGTLHITSAGSVFADIIISQKVKLVANTYYIFDGLFKDQSDDFQNAWVQFNLDLEGNTISSLYDGFELYGISAYSGCGAGEEGWISDVACDYGDYVTHDAYLVPDTLGDTITATFAVIVGLYTSGSAYPYDIVLDELTIYDSATVESTSAVEDISAVNSALSIYPNPIKEEANISYSLSESGNCEFIIINSLGQKVASLFDDYKSAGTYQSTFNSSNLSDGIYIGLLINNNKTIAKQTLIIQ